MGVMDFKSKASGTLPFEVGLLYDVLTDYDTYSEWLPFITQSKLLAREGDLAIAEFELAKSKGEKFAIECIHTRNKMVLTRRISGAVPVSQVEWTLEAADAGSTRVTVELLGTAFWKRLLPGYSSLANGNNWLRSLQTHAATFSGGVSIEGEGGEKIIEIFETGEGLVCWIRGKKYIMQPAPEGKQ
jgi:ribosome-associated toxin RatA of RatAB toxin-antitoxin module